MCPRFSSGLGFGASRARPTSPDFAGNQSLGSDVGRRTLRKGAQYRQHARQPQGHVRCRLGRAGRALRLPARINDLCQPPTHHICSSAGFAGHAPPGQVPETGEARRRYGRKARDGSCRTAGPWPTQADSTRPKPAHAGGHEPATVELEVGVPQRVVPHTSSAADPPVSSRRNRALNDAKRSVFKAPFPHCIAIDCAVIGWIAARAPSGVPPPS
jgi:hypothetical protein